MDPFNPKTALTAAEFITNFKRLGAEFNHLSKEDKLCAIYLADWHGFTFEEIMEGALWEEVSIWQNSSVEEVALDLVEKGDAFPDCPEDVKRYIDYNLLGKDLLASGFEDTGVHTFYFPTDLPSQ
tara:strand:- start:1290 stop:1664 length:375 start_codon:yes stop_codon:yes gene_type:complete